MIKMHRTFQRYVAALMLLSFAAMFGAAYLPDNLHEDSKHKAASLEMVMGTVMAPEMSGPHDCCDQDMAGYSVEDLRCSVDCSYYLTPTVLAFRSSSPAFGDGVTHSMFLARKTSFLRPPIA